MQTYPWPRSRDCCRRSFPQTDVPDLRTRGCRSDEDSRVPASYRAQSATQHDARGDMCEAQRRACRSHCGSSRLSKSSTGPAQDGAREPVHPYQLAARMRTHASDLGVAFHAQESRSSCGSLCSRRLCRFLVTPEKYAISGVRRPSRGPRGLSRDRRVSARSSNWRGKYPRGRSRASSGSCAPRHPRTA